jgi:ribosomal protein S18 acetylase RimI-like enzyme
VTGIVVRRATSDAQEIARIAPLFDAYRQFYRQPPDPGLALEFITARLRAGESVVLLATDSAHPGVGVGFTQLYRTFSSVSACRILVLNDLYVAPEYRRHGVARLLMEAARALAAEEGVGRILLETAEDNVQAQRLYESLGYVWTPSSFRTYVLDLARDRSG